LLLCVYRVTFSLECAHKLLSAVQSTVCVWIHIIYTERETERARERERERERARERERERERERAVQQRVAQFLQHVVLVPICIMCSLYLIAV